MDLTRPVMDGNEATAQIIDFHPHAIVIACTADIQTRSVPRILSLGALMVLKKPSSRETVGDALARAEEQIG